jgi:hypothetical protein
MLDGLVNNIDGSFQGYTKSQSKSLIWINLHNPQIGTQEQKIHAILHNFLHLIKIRHQLNKNLLKYK